MNHKIRHEGIVDSIEEECVHVRILQTSACASCKVAGYCNAAEAKEKIVDVFQTKGSSLKVGDAVTVSASGDVAARLVMGFRLAIPPDGYCLGTCTMANS